MQLKDISKFNSTSIKDRESNSISPVSQIQEKRTHNKGVAICKGICISLMVMGHTAIPGIIGEWLCAFRMPLFFFMSGYMFKPESTFDPKRFMKKRVKGLYWPFVKWSLIFLLFHNLLYSLNFYSFSYSKNDFIDKLISAFTLNGSDQLLGGYWFLIEALFSSIIAFSFLFILYRLFPKEIKGKYIFINQINKFKNWGGCNLLIICILAILFIIAAYFLDNHKVLFKIKNGTLLATAFFLFGHFFRKLDLKISLWMAIGIMFLSYAIFQLYDSHLSIWSTGKDVFVLIPIALFSISALLEISKIISNSRIGTFLDFAGTNTLMILTFHMISFKAVNLGIIWRDDLPIERLADFTYINTGNSYDWIFYSIAGICLPLGGVLLTRYIKEKLLIKSVQLKKS